MEVDHKEEDREIWVGENRFFLGEDNILYVTNIDSVDDNMGVEIKVVMQTLIDKNEEKVNLLIDINKAGKPSAKARKDFKEIIDYKKVGNVAVFGAHPVARVIASFVMGITRNKDIRFFKTKEEALTWLT